MNTIFSLIALILVAVSISVAQKPDVLAHTSAQTYELYSWRQSNGVWNFSLLPSPSGVNIPAAIVFDQKFVIKGVDQLDRKISKLPDGVTLLWLDRIVSSQSSKAPGGLTLTFPPADIVGQVKRYASKKRIEVKLYSDNPFS
jgi:hypothetical protein